MVPREPSDEGVSPVVGMILVLGISVVGIAAILYWGLPAIDEMKANVEHRSAGSQFAELDASIKELVAGTTERTAKRWQPTLNRGYVSVAPETEAWVYATETYAGRNYAFAWTGLADGDHVFTLTNLDESAANDLEISAHIVSSTTLVDNLEISTEADGDPLAEDVDLAIGGSKELYVRDEDGEVLAIEDQTVRFRVYSATTGEKLAEAWFVPTGRVDYRLDAGMGTKTVTENNGAVITGDGIGYTLASSPPLPPISDTGAVPRFFARAVALEGEATFAGDDRFDLLVTLRSTATLASYDCALETYADCVASARIFIFGDYAETWFTYLTNEGRGYEFTEGTVDPDGAGGDDPIPYIEQREDQMGFTLLQSRIRLSTGGS